MIRRPPRSPLFPSTPLFRSLPDPSPWRDTHRRVEPFFLYGGVRAGGETPGVSLFDRETLTVHHRDRARSEEHTSELQSQSNLVCRLLLEKKNNINIIAYNSFSHTKLKINNRNGKQMDRSIATSTQDRKGNGLANPARTLRDLRRYDNNHS